MQVRRAVISGFVFFGGPEYYTRICILQSNFAAYVAITQFKLILWSLISKFGKYINNSI